MSAPDLAGSFASAVRVRTSRRGMLAGIAAFALLLGAGGDSGAYFAGSWGWLTLAGAWAAALVVALAEPALSRAGLLFAGLLAAFAGWTALSASWSSDVTQSALEARRALVYAAVAGAAVVCFRGRSRVLLSAVWAAAAALCAYGLATRFFPDRIGIFDPTAEFRLSEPVGYWNGLAILAAVGLSLGLWIAARGERMSLRALAGASIVPLLATLYFTFSRGAWLAAAVGIAIALAFETRRTQVLVLALALAPFAAASVVLCSHATALTTSDFSLAAMRRDGHRLAAILVLLALAAGGVVTLAARWDGRLAVQRRTGLAAVAALAAAVVVAAIAVFAATDPPWTLASRGWHRFSAEPPTQPQNLNDRLTSVSGGWRTQLWAVGGRMVEAHPLLGEGAGSFPRAWVRERPNDQPIRDAHSLYLQTLAEVGPLGLLLLLGALAVPLVVVRRVREAPLAAGALGAYAAYVLHTGIDWEWQIPGVTLPALLCGAALLLDGGPELRIASGRARSLGLAAAVAVAGIGLWGIASQTLLSRIAPAAQRGDLAAAARDARRAADLEPWSTQPWQTLGEAQLAARRPKEALVSFRRGLAQDPDDWTLWLDVARSSQWPLLPKAVREVERLNPHSPELARFRQALASLSELGRTAP
ncbi:MAG TPA: O-antigen ligase family protein [Gaiellaceae bacterium]|nr:O-antigen ligase family protein [Gaiellaceae bacterium]